MNYEKIAESVQEGISSRRVVAGMVQVPPAMVEEIYRWAAANVASNNIISLLSYKKNMILTYGDLTPKGIQDTWDFIEREGNPENIDKERFFKTRNERRKDYENDLDIVDKDIKKAKKVVSLYPVKKGRWKSKRKVFRANLDGWKYKSLLDKASPDKVSMADEVFGKISVTIANNGLRGNSAGVWNANTNSLRISTFMSNVDRLRDLRDVIEHELIHWAQSYLGILNMPSKFGLPGRKERTPEFNQNMKARGKLLRKLKDMGLTGDAVHDMDDSEFYTELHDAYLRIKRRLIIDMRDNKDVFNEMVGANGDPKDKYLSTLKRGSRAKWQKAVKELAKAVL